MLWDMYWGLIDVHGFNSDVYGDSTTGGNNLAIQLVLDGMKLQPCSPGFVDGRDAILQADQILTGGENECTIWEAFANRGLGFSASPVTADGRFYLRSSGGEILVVRGGAVSEVMARNDMGEPLMATPVLSSDTMFVRGRGDHLFAMGR